jgi:hypothetical protein
MPRGPKGEKRPADVIGNAVHVMRIATGEIEESFGKAPKRAKGYVYAIVTPGTCAASWSLPALRRSGRAPRC